MSKSSEQSILKGIHRVLSTFSKVGGVVVSISGLAYVLGWVYARSYYSDLGAEWLVPALPASQLMGFALWPALTIIFLFYTVVTDMVSLHPDSDLSKSAFSWIKKTYFKGVIGVLVIGLLKIIFETLGFPVAVNICRSAYIVSMVVVTVSSLVFICIHFSDDKSELNLRIISISGFALFWGVWSVPSEMGKRLAARDLDFERNGLPVVKFKNSSKHHLAISILSNRVYYITPVEQGITPKVKTAEIDAVDWISKPPSKERTKLFEQQVLGQQVSVEQPDTASDLKSEDGQYSSPESEESSQ